MATKQGVGIWKHYRTTDRADGLQAKFQHKGKQYRAKLYWAPADFNNPDAPEKCAYCVVWTKLPDSKDEVRWSEYVGADEPRRSWNKLLKVAEEIDKARLVQMADDAIWYHDEMLSHGCTYSPVGCYNFPLGGDTRAIIASVNEAWCERVGRKVEGLQR